MTVVQYPTARSILALCLSVRQQRRPWHEISVKRRNFALFVVILHLDTVCGTELSSLQVSVRAQAERVGGGDARQLAATTCT